MSDVGDRLDAAPGSEISKGPSDPTSITLSPEHGTRVEFWTTFGLLPSTDSLHHSLPEGVVVFEANAAAAHSRLAHFLSDMGVPPLLAVKAGDLQQLFFRVADPQLVDVLVRSVPSDVGVAKPGDTIVLPSLDDWQPSLSSSRSVGQLSELTAIEVSRVAKTGIAPALPARDSNPLTKHSLRGQSETFRKQAIIATPLLGDLCLSGQVTVWYAAPNTGKTLIALNLLIDAVKAGRIAGGNVYYINADDSSEGLATKLELMDDLGVHTLAPGFGDFNAGDLVSRLTQMAAREEARGVFVLIDTTKKFVSLMDKKDSSAFGTACRHVAMRGGAVLNLAHTTKSPNADGSPRFAGTTDLVDDADAAYTIARVDVPAEHGERVVEFKCFKQRGGSADAAAFAYAAESGVSYLERLASVRPIDLSAVNEFKRIHAQQADEEIVEVIAACIAEGHNTKMILGKEAALRAKLSTREAHRFVERYTGIDPTTHRWRYKVRERGAKVFELLPPAN